MAFVVALVAIKFFITFLKKYGFQVWGVYRVIVGVALLVLIELISHPTSIRNSETSKLLYQAEYYNKSLMYDTLEGHHVPVHEAESIRHCP